MLLWFQALVSATQVPGSKPTFTNIQNLYQFNGNADNLGSWSTVLNVRGTPTYTTDVPFGSGQAMVFNGSSGLYNESGPISGTGAFSLATWVKPTSLPGAAYLISQRDAQNTGQFSLYLSAGGVAFVDGNATTVTGPTYTTALTVGKWTHIAAVRANNVMRLYIDGVQVATMNKSPANIITTNGLCLGHDQRGPGSYLNGYMKDVIVANRELSANEILWMAKSNSYFPTS